MSEDPSMLPLAAFFAVLNREEVYAMFCHSSREIKKNGN